MREARLEGGTRVGAIAGSAYGTVDASAEFVRRIYSKGAKLASPLVFPNLVPSSLVGHAAIYLGLRGPVFSVAELGLSGEAAFWRPASSSKRAKFRPWWRPRWKSEACSPRGSRASVLGLQPLDGGSRRRVVEQYAT